jgi:hypothetical protein
MISIRKQFLFYFEPSPNASYWSIVFNLIRQNMENKSSLDKDLISFYFLKFNKLFLFGEPSSSPTSTTTECLLFHLLLRYEVKELGKLKKYPKVIQHIMEVILAQGKLISTLEKGIMGKIPNFFNIFTRWKFLQERIQTLFRLFKRYSR